MTLQSMTGFASVEGENTDISWIWEARSVNNRGLDVRLRFPEGYEALEPVVRKQISSIFARGSISLALKVKTLQSDKRLSLDPIALDSAIRALGDAQKACAVAGLSIEPARISDLLALRGVAAGGSSSADVDSSMRDEVANGLATLLTRLKDTRSDEGKTTEDVIRDQLAQIAALVDRAGDSIETRRAKSGAILRERVEAILATSNTVEEARLAQELAIIAVKSDVTEEIDRIRGHVSAVRKLMSTSGPVGRKLDFLTQEFNREANTLCSKAGDADLTAIGIEMKVVIDQMREQAQNVE